MKKTLLGYIAILLGCYIGLLSPSPAFASVSCNPPTDYSGCPEQHPDYNLDVLTYEPVTGNLNLNDFGEEEWIDVKAPQLSTLIDGNPTPAVTSLYNLHYWNWTTNSPDVLVPRPDNLGSQYDFATLVGFSTTPGQSILVPDSGYDIGRGYEVMVLYADNNSLTLHYGNDDGVSLGYTIYLENFQVNPDLIAYYNQVNAAGRTELPVLMAGMKIGTALDEILVAIRDTGSFMDPRWIKAWWLSLVTGIPIELLLQALGVQIPPFASLTCHPDSTGDRDSRPYYNRPDARGCDLCNMTNMFCSSCATSFTVSDTVSWEWHEKDFDCEGNAWKRTPWGGDITIDPTQTTIPFVGNKGNEKEDLYLADYFDGTNEYYKNFPQYWLDWVNHAGVLRKLTPMEYQDELKKDMVKRAVKATSQLREGNIHNYELEYIGRICWDLPFLADAFSALLQNLGVPLIDDVAKIVANNAHRCVFSGDIPGPTAFRTAINIFNTAIPGTLFDISYRWGDKETDRLASLDGNFPPELDEENYLEKWQEWKKSEWGRLWEVVPMTSREDTPGWIYPYLGSKPLDTFTILNPDAQIEKVPHVARLYEVTQEIQNIFLPSTTGGLTSQKKTGPIIASPGEEKVLGEKTLLAQACLECPILSIANPSYSNGAIYWTYSLCHSCPGHGCIGDVFVGPCGNVQVKENVCPPCFSTSHPAIAPPAPISCPGTAFICAAFKCDNCEGCPGSWQSTTCSVEVDADCNIIKTTCGIVGPPSAPTCGLPEARPVNQCELTAIADTNPNDELCCKPIDIKLDAVDMFDEYPYTPCEYDCPECVLYGMCPCNPECETEETRGVNREIGINLSHPYLTPIWEQTAKNESNGIFNIFRPAEISAFEELDAHSEIHYSQTGFEGLEPPVGKFYYNYLGGVQKAKEWVTTKVLMPYVEQ